MDEGSGVSAGDLGIAGLADAVEVGRGGFAVVYRCRQPAFGRTVAVKVLRGAVGDDAARRRFQRECLAMGTLSGHPNIVTVYDAGFLPSGDPYIVMDFMSGGSLADRVAANGPMSSTELLRTGVMLCGALESAHQSGVLHRDIKPENVMRSSYGAVKLTDFGIARLRGGPETRTEGLTASIPHVAPELLAGAPASVQSDLYAVGSTMFHLLTGEAAFVRATDESILPALTRIASEPVPDLRARGVPAEVCDLIESLMAKDPDTRPAAAEAVGRRLQRLQAASGIPMTEMAIQAVDASGDVIDEGPDDGATRARIPQIHTPAPPAPDPPPPVHTPPPVYTPAPAPFVPGPGATEPAPSKRTGQLVGAIALIVVAAVVGGALLLADRGTTPVVDETASTGPTAAAEPTARESAQPEPSEVAEVPTTAVTTRPEPPPPEVQRPAPVPLAPARTDSTSTAPPGIDASGATVRYEPDNLVDRRLDTAWRAEGSGRGVELSLLYDRAIYVDAIGLVPGYAKIDPSDGTDRFYQNRRIRRVRYHFSNGEQIDARFSESPELQYVDVGLVTDWVLVEILATSKPGDRNFAAISEIEVLGSVEQ